MGAYLAVLQTLGLEKSLAQVAQDDPLGRHLPPAERLEHDGRRSGLRVPRRPGVPKVVPAPRIAA